MRVSGARWLVWFTAWINTGLCSGIIFGWPSFVLILKDENIYRDDCGSVAAGESCSSQELKLNIIFTIGFAGLIGSRLAAGTFLDFFGPKCSAVTGGMLNVVGSLLVAVADPDVFDVFAVGFFLLGCGGSLVHLANFHISNLFPAYSRTIVSSYSAVFSVSGIVLVVVQFLYEYAWSSRRGWMLIYMGLMCMVTLSSWVIHSRRPFPRGCKLEFNPLIVAFQPIEPKAPASDAKVTKGSGSQGSEEHASTGDVEVVKVDMNMGVDAGDADSSKGSLSKPPIANPEPHTLRLPLWRQILSLPFFTILVVFSTVLLQLQFFVATAQLQLEEKGDTKDATNYAYSRTFTIMNALTSPLFIPFVGYVLDKRGFSTALTIVFGLATMHNVIAAFVPWLEVQPVSFLCLTLSRFLVFATLFAWCIHFFGFKSFGKTAGLISTVASLINLTQYGFTALTVEALGNNFVWVNSFWILILQPLYLVPFVLSRPGQRLVNWAADSFLRKPPTMAEPGDGETNDIELQSAVKTVE